ncbi:unnamed protein product [Peniophora sp. CBMAI 1063]|nr:unnamed protein product [Peniophora sp. CBMAI 1063]
MRLYFSSTKVTDTVISDEHNRPLYATSSSTYLRHTQILKCTPTAPTPVNFATIDFHNFSPDYLTLRGEKFKVTDFLERPVLNSNRREFVLANGTKFVCQWVANIWRLSLLDGPEVGRSHVYLPGLNGDTPNPSFIEFSDDPRVLNSLDDLIVIYVYTRFRHEHDVTRRRRERSSGLGMAGGGVDLPDSGVGISDSSSGGFFDSGIGSSTDM